MTDPAKEVARRRTFAIISHPDAGKTTVTEKLLLLGGAINTAGTIKARKSSRYATSDWMEIERQRGISVTSSVMQFDYRDRVVNLLDTPGHGDFSEDTYRTLTAVDSALMVIDAAKGVEERTIKLLEVCRLRKTPVMTFINKLDRHAREPIDLLDEIEQQFNISCAPVTWPLGSGQQFVGLYRFDRDVIVPYPHAAGATVGDDRGELDLATAATSETFGPYIPTLREEIELVTGAGHDFDVRAYLSGDQTPVFFGTALKNFGVGMMLDCFVETAPPPLSRETNAGSIEPLDPAFSGFVFKIQANMDPQHRDRIAFLRICSGKFEQGTRMTNVRLNRSVIVANALTFLARGRDRADTAWPGDIIGIHNHGTIQIGDTFTTGAAFSFQGIPSFAPELFRRVRATDPLRSKALLKGLKELGEEGVAQFFRLIDRNDLILGAVGVLQFDVMSWRLQHEYKVECVFEPVQLQAARWVTGKTPDELERFRKKVTENVAYDGWGDLTYLAPTLVNLQLIQERWPELEFHATRELSIDRETLVAAN